MRNNDYNNDTSWEREREKIEHTEKEIDRSCEIWEGVEDLALGENTIIKSNTEQSELLFCVHQDKHA